MQNRGGKGEAPGERKKEKSEEEKRKKENWNPAGNLSFFGEGRTR
jgi:hypothetical protein